MSGAAASSGDVDLVEASVRPLQRPYLPARRPAVTRELDGVAAKLAAQLHGKVARRAAPVVAGRTAWQYEIAYDGKVEEITFILHGRREYELLCRRAAAGDDGPCRQLVASFLLR